MTLQNNTITIKRTLKNTLLVAALSSTLSVSAVAEAKDILIPTLTLAAGFLNHPNFTYSDDYHVDDDIWITSSDGVTLAANVLTPTSGNGPFPAIIFVNSWTMNEYEYTIEAQKLAADGYVVLSYSTRGFGSSEGLIDTAGPIDISDYSHIIDWLIEHTPTDPERIGSAGISYGSGISLIGAAQDNRIKAVAAMSSWGSLKDSLYGNNTPPLVWGQLLDYSSMITGRPDPVIHEYYNAMLDQEVERTDELIEWATPRSPLTYVKQLNENGTAIYLAKNWGDDMFHANSIVELYTKLTGPKHLDLVPGTHATNEILGMLGLDSNRVLDNAHRWFDYHLKGENSGIQNEPPVQMEVKISGKIEGFSDIPVPESTLNNYYLHPRGFGIAGELESYPFQSWWTKTDKINSLFDTVASTGIPIVSQLVEQFNIPTIAPVPLMARHQGIWFETDRLRKVMKIRGNTELTLQIEPQNKQAQLVAYLYDMNRLGSGTLITHAPFTLPVTTPGKALTIDFDLVTTAYDIPKGHKLVLAIDTQDIHYGKPPKSLFKVAFKFNSDKQSVLRVPVL